MLYQVLFHADIATEAGEFTLEDVAAHMTQKMVGRHPHVFGDVVADTARMNENLQAYIDAQPAQYYWVHKRFKTRPEGEPSVY